MSYFYLAPTYPAIFYTTSAAGVIIVRTVSLTGKIGTATAQNFSLYRGDALHIQVTVYESDGVTSQNLSGITVNWTMRYGGYTLQKSTASGITITDAANGIVQIALQPSDTSSLASGTYSHNLTLTDSAGDVSTILTGTAQLL